MAKIKGVPDQDNFLKPKKKKPKGEADITAQSMLRRLKRKAQQVEKGKQTKAKNSSVISAPVGRASTHKRFDALVKRVSKETDIRKLKKMIYNRNYNLKKKFERENPDLAAERNILKFPPAIDIRTVGKSTLKRLAKIGDEQKLIEELRRIIIDGTRRRNKPKTTGDYSNKEQDYLANAVDALMQAVNNWDDEILSMKVHGALKQVTMSDIVDIFKKAPSYWAISSGYYYAIADFDDFMSELFRLVERSGVVLSDLEKEEMTERIFSNDPREFK